MSAFTPTAAQRAAIESRGSAVLVSAGAGSGKTKVLTERLMGYLTDRDHPRDIDSFLVITFTRAAAGELKGRIMEELSSAIAADPANRHLRRQSALIRRAQISTIHGFCGELLRQNGHLLGLAPDFGILEDDRSAAMKSAALEKVMEESYEHAAAYPGFLRLADTVGAGRDDRRLCELVLELHEKMQCHARPEKWAEESIERLRAPADDAAQTPWGREILATLRQSADYWAGEMERLIAAMRAEEKIFTAYGPSVEETADALRELSRALRAGWDCARERLPVPFPKLKGLRESPDPALSEAVKARREACKASCKGMEKALSASSETMLRGMSLTHDAMEALLRLTLRFDQQYAKDKRRLSVLDYADLEHFAARLLTEEDGSPSPLSRQVAARYTEIMVDEYQDVSRVQDAIFRAVSGDGKNLFLVGDVKQSIYRFRLADPAIFTEKYDSYADWESAPDGAPRRILLRENFRSRREVIDAANAVFAACMSRSLGDIDYDEAAALKYAASYEGESRKPELLLLDARTDADDEETPARIEREAEMTAARIEALVRSGTPVADGEGRRSAAYGDIAILLRSPGSAGAAFRRALERRGIPVAAARGGEFFTSEEIATVLSVLSALDNPHQDIELLAALRSPCFAFTADELSALRAADRDGDLYTALRAYAAGNEKAKAALDKLAALRAAAPDLSCASLLWEIVGTFDLLAVAGAMDDGERRRANLMELIALSERFEATGYRGLHRFVLWLRRLAEKGQEISSAAPASGVQILSVHKSKGLEFPIVFLCDLSRRFNLRDSAARVLVHPELGLGAKVTDLERRVEYPTLARTAIARRLRRETLSEEMRLLYVAMTRAKEYLFLTASVKDPSARLEKLRAGLSLPLAPEALSDATCPLDWLLAASYADNGEHLAVTICEDEKADDLPESDAAGAAPDEDFLALLRHNLSFAYPHAASEALPSKITATELKDRAAPDEDARSIAPHPRRSFRLPDFAREQKPLRGAERGTATHLVLQYMDFSKATGEEGVRAEIERMRQKRFLSDREAEAVDAQAIVRLFSSPLGRRMLSAKTITREFKFSLLCPADEVLGVASTDKVLLQGVVDCLLEEDGELTVIDYKTDAVRTEEQLRERTALYTPQLRAYAKAVERIFRKPVKECVLYFLSMGRESRVGIEGKE